MSIKDLLSYITKGQDSKNVAKERLRLVLIHDRSEVSSELLELLKEEIIEVISKYMEIDKGSSRIDLHNSEGAAVLEANLSIKSIKRGREGVNVRT